MIPPEPPPICAASTSAAGQHPDLRAVEAQLRQAQKMETIGRLAGGLVHDFNNLLAVVIGSTEALAQALEGDRELSAIARTALCAAERGADLASRLLTFARNQPLAPQAIDCGPFLAEMARMLEHTLGASVGVEVRAPEAPLFCLADRTQLTCALLNLAINARDAMKAGGILTLSAERRRGADGREEALLSVRDTGEGMTPQVLERAREPFFTTKPVGEGSGLGLSMVHGFASQSGGRLEMDSAPGRGAEARLYLPRAVAGANGDQPEAAAA